MEFFIFSQNKTLFLKMSSSSKNLILKLKKRSQFEGMKNKLVFKFKKVHKYSNINLYNLIIA